MVEMGEDPDELSPSLQKALIMKRAGTVPTGYMVLADESALMPPKPLAPVAAAESRGPAPRVQGTGETGTRLNRIAPLTDPLPATPSIPPVRQPAPVSPPDNAAGNAMLERMLNMPTD